MNFFTTTSETGLFPREDEEVKRLAVLVEEAECAAEPARQAWRNYLAKHYEDTIRVPWPEDKARLANADRAAQQTVERAAAALDLALTAATERAKQAWNTRILDQFRDDDATITQFIDLLDRHEQLVDEASRAAVRGVHKVAEIFLTATEVRARYDYARRAMGLTS